MGFPAFVNEKVVRWNAAVTVVVIVAAWFVSPWLLVPLAADFATRVFIGPRFSPLAQSGIHVLNALRVAPKMIAGAPKRFAAGIGFTMTTGALLLLLAGVDAGWWVAGAIGVFACLEAAFAFCAGCVLYRWLGRLGIVNACPTCVQGPARIG